MAGELISIGEARERVLAACRPLGVEHVPVADALGRVLASDLVADGDVPPFASSAMDGFALRAGPAGRKLRVGDESKAGHPAARELRDGEAFRISTGAVMPAGADAVARVEDTEERDGEVTIAVEIAPGDNVRGAGEDLPAGATALSAGTELGPCELAVSGSTGVSRLPCAVSPRLAVLVTGDELVEPGAALGPGQIHSTNPLALAGLATRAGARVVRSSSVPDDAEATRGAFAAALDGCDVLVISGGVSVGPHDHVKPALRALGVEEHFWGVALQPGKPTWFGVRDGTLVFGLPGNPVSAIVTFVLFARPALRALQGAAPLPPRDVAVLGESLRRNPRREQAVRLSLEARDGRLQACTTGDQRSHRLSSMLGAAALGFVPRGEGELATGDTIETERI